MKPDGRYRRVGLLGAGAIVLSALLLSPAAALAREGRTVSGAVHFTNNTPRDRERFPVELYTRDGERRVAAAAQGDGGFEFRGLRPGRYLLKLTWPGRCTLLYRVDLRRRSRTGVTILMDAACSRADGLVQDLPSD